MNNKFKECKYQKILYPDQLSIDEKATLLNK